MDMEQRVKDLQNQVDDLNEKVEILEKKLSFVEEQNLKIIEIRSRRMPQNKKSKNKIKIGYDKTKNIESFIGKYFVGILSALLLCIAIVSFIAIMWDKTTPLAKVMIVGLSGVVISIAGLVFLILKIKNISSVLLSLGCFFLLTAVISANLVFNLVDVYISLASSLLIAVLFAVSFKFTGSFFTLIITYTGIYTNIVFLLKYIKGEMDFLILTLYIVIYAIALIISTKSEKKSNHIYTLLLVSFLFMTMLSFTHTMMGKAGFDIIFSFVCFFAATVSVLLNFYTIKLLHDEENIKKYNFLSFLAIFNIVITTAEFSGAVSGALSYISFLIAGLAEFIYIHKFVKLKKSYYIDILFFFAFYLDSYYFSLEYLDMRMGSLFVMIVFLMRYSVFREKISKRLIYIPFIVDLCFSFTAFDIESKTVILLLLCSVFLIYISRITEDEKSFEKNIPFSFFLAVLYILMTANLNIENIPESIVSSVSYTISVLFIFIMFKFGLLFPPQSDDDFDMEYILSKKYIFFGSKLLIIFGILQIFAFNFDQAFQNTALMFTSHIIQILAVCFMLFVDSFFVLKKYSNDINYIVLIFEYIAFLWGFINSFDCIFDISMFVYSISGLILSLILIFFGFRYKNIYIRRYGLILTILMVIKFILVDLDSANSITRIIAFLAGSFICLVISIIYNRISKNIG